MYESLLVGISLSRTQFNLLTLFFMQADLVLRKKNRYCVVCRRRRLRRSRVCCCFGATML